MKPIRPLLLFAVKSIVLYVAFIVLANTTGFSKVYRDIYINLYSFVYNNMYENADIKCDKLEGKKSGDDIVFTFANKNDIEKAKKEARQTGKVQTSIKGFKWSFNTYRVELMFLLFLVALILAHSSDWKHKLKGIFIGLLIFYFLTFLLLAGRLAFQMHNNQSVFPEYKLTSLGEQILSTVTTMHTEAMFFFAILIWGIAMVRKKDFDLLK